MLISTPNWRWLESLATLGLCRALDRHLVHCCLHEYQQQVQPLSAADAEALMFWLTLCSGQVAQGHICLDLELACREPASLLPSSTLPYGAVYQQFKQQLQAQTLPQLLQLLQAHPQLIGAQAPFVLRQQRLYLRRYALIEQQIIEFIGRRAQVQLPVAADVLAQAIDDWFGQPKETLDWQRLACAMAASRAFSVITGGPGTGKTTTVVRLVGVLSQLAAQQQGSLQLALAAPTGKAAARLTESFELAVGKLSAEQQALLSRVPSKAQTIHRLLGRGADGQFRFHAGNPLPLDVLIVDEASMVDAELLAAVLAALPATARLVLLGDKDQLASVEAGAVLAELCDQAEAAHYRSATVALLQQLTGQLIESCWQDEQGTLLQQQVAMLRESRRFAADSGIGVFASAVNRGDIVQIERWLGGTDPLGQDVRFMAATSSADLWPVLRAELSPLWQQVKQLELEPLDDAALTRHCLALLAQLAQLQVLCAVRQGPWGVETVNLQLQQYLRKMGDIKTAADWYAGRVVMVRQNDYSTGLMNGDVGLCVRWQESPEVFQQKVVFADGQGGVRFFLPNRLPEVETAFAVTVHKSQGSEYQHAMLLMPDTDSPVLTRELLYTAITRAKTHFSLVLPEPSLLQHAVRRRTERRGGLRVSQQDAFLM